MMKSKCLILLFLCSMLMGCSPQFTCGYHPEKFKLTDVFSIDGKDIKIGAAQLAEKIEKFGLDNGYCIANGSMDQPSLERYLINIRIVKAGFSFYISGTNNYDFWLQQKDVTLNFENEKNKFCNFIKPFLNTDEVEYSKKGKLCKF